MKVKPDPKINCHLERFGVYFANQELMIPLQLFSLTRNLDIGDEVSAFVNFLQTFPHAVSFHLRTDTNATILRTKELFGYLKDNGLKVSFSESMSQNKDVFLAW